jgi:hypothetical protein
MTTPTDGTDSVVSKSQLHKPLNVATGSMIARKQAQDAGKRTPVQDTRNSCISHLDVISERPILILQRFTSRVELLSGGVVKKHDSFQRMTWIEMGERKQVLAHHPVVVRRPRPRGFRGFRWPPAGVSGDLVGS